MERTSDSSPTHDVEDPQATLEPVEDEDWLTGEEERRRRKKKKKKKKTERRHHRHETKESYELRPLELGGDTAWSETSSTRRERLRGTTYEGMATYDIHVRDAMERTQPQASHGLGLQMLMRDPNTRDTVFARDIRMALEDAKEDPYPEFPNEHRIQRRDSHLSMGPAASAVLARRRARSPKKKRFRQRRHYGTHNLGRIKEITLAKIAKERNVTVDTLEYALEVDPAEFAESVTDDAEAEEDIQDRMMVLLDLRMEIRRRVARARWHAAINHVRDQVRAALAIRNLFDPIAQNSGLRSWLSLYAEPGYSDLYASHLPVFMAVVVMLQVVFFVAYGVSQSVTPNATSPTMGPEFLELRLVEYECAFEGCADSDGDGVREAMWELLEVNDRRHEGWRYLSYSLLHSGYVHLIGNVIVEIILGFPLEAVHGWQIGILYVLSVIGGAFTFVWSNPHETIVGSSGGLYGLLGVHFANLALNWDAMTIWWMKLGRVVLCVLLGVAIAFQLYDRSGNEATTAHGVHIGGFITGFLFALPLLRDIKADFIEQKNQVYEANNERWKMQEMPKYHGLIVTLGLVGGIGYILFGIIWYATHEDPTPVGTWWGPYDPVDDWCSTAEQSNVCAPE